MPSRDSHHSICKRRCEIVGTTVGADLVSARIYNNNPVYVIRYNRADTRSAPTKRVPLAVSLNPNLSINKSYLSSNGLLYNIQRYFFRKALGVRPISFLNVRLKLLASVKPHLSTMVPMPVSVVAKYFLAAASR